MIVAVNQISDRLVGDRGDGFEQRTGGRRRYMGVHHKRVELADQHHGVAHGIDRAGAGHMPDSLGDFLEAVSVRFNYPLLGAELPGGEDREQQAKVARSRHRFHRYSPCEMVD